MLKETLYSTAASENIVKSPVRAIVVSGLPHKSPVSKNVASENNEQDNKENGEFQTYNVRSKLQRLGKLYSGKRYSKVIL